MNFLSLLSENNSMSRKTSAILILVTSVLWSTSGLFIKLLQWNPVVTAGMRSLIAAAVIYVFVHKQKIVIDKGAIICGVLSMLSLVSFVTANKLTSSANAIMLQYTSPVFVLIFSVLFLKHKVKKRDLAVTACTLLGMFLFFVQKMSPGQMLGNILAVFSGATFACISIYCATYKQNSLHGILLGQILTFAISIPFLFLTKVDFSPTPILIILFLGILQLGIPYIIYSAAMRHATPLDGVLISMAEPLLNPVWVFLVVGELPGVLSIVGGIVVILSVTFWCMYNVKEELKKSAAKAEKGQL